MNKSLVVLAALILLGSAANVVADSPTDRVPRIGLDEFKTLHADDAIYLIDVRSPVQYGSGHIPGAVLRPFGQLNRFLSELRRVTKPIVAYCQ